MRKFLIKFLGVFAIFFIPASYYQLRIAPETSGDIGELGKIPFGKEQAGIQVDWYHRNMDPPGVVINISDPDSLSLFHTVTVGDSFSNQGTTCGYQYSLSNRLQDTVANFRGFPGCEVLENYLILLNRGFIKSGQTVILESVERSFVGRFSCLDSLESYCTIPQKEVRVEGQKHQEPFLSGYFSWIRLSAGYDNPTQAFSLSRDCFTHDRYSRTLYVYNSKKIGDGDILWKNISPDAYRKAESNIMKMINLSEKKGINFYILIACDKYDAYEPLIVNPHEKNPTLDNIPRHLRIFDTRACLRDAIERGTKDVYKLNNTHWSVIGADIVGNNLFERISQLR
ncbi:MAG: hypothetical protein J6Y32_08540 [Bacteroidales bacterium]|nr:hypothetical protein [Bacteroidales bacterium]